MEAEVLKVQRHESKYKGASDFYFIFMKELVTGKSFRTCVGVDYRNFYKWSPVINADNPRGVKLRGLRTKQTPKGIIVDADSCVEVIQ